MEQMFKIEVYLDYEGFRGVSYKSFLLSRDELLHFGREFRKGVLVQLGEFLINKRHIVSIRFANLDKAGIKNYMDDVISLGEDPLLLPNDSEEDE